MTDRGWGVAGAGLAALCLWVLLGEVELLVAGSVLAAAVGIGFALVWSRTPHISVIRRLLPNLAHEGDTAEVRALCTNHGRWRLHNLTISDTVGSMGSARFEVGRIRPDETVQVNYRILCRPRGVYMVGPAEIQLTDPARLVSRSTGSHGADRLVVYPAVEELNGFPLARGMDPSMHAARPEFANRGGEDFYTLREYVAGDDLRFIHWPSSAKRDTLLIRQMETPWQQRALIMLDVRRSVYDTSACFEHAVRAAASLVLHYGRQGFESMLWAGGVDPLPISQTVAVMERLAVVRADESSDLRVAAARVRQRGGGGTLLLVSGTPDATLAEVSRLLGQDYGATIALCATGAPSTSSALMHRAGVRTVEANPGESWADGWSQMVEAT